MNDVQKFHAEMISLAIKTGATMTSEPIGLQFTADVWREFTMEILMAMNLAMEVGRGLPNDNRHH